MQCLIKGSLYSQLVRCNPLKLRCDLSEIGVNMVYYQTYLRDIYLNYLILLADLTVVVLAVGCGFRGILSALAILQV